MLRKSLCLYTTFFHLEGLRVIIEKQDRDEEPLAEATVKVKIGGRTSHQVADGNGPVNALDNALRKALEEAYPRLKDIRLADYKVRVLNERRGTSAKVRVLIESTDGVQTWGTVGVSTNLIEASWRALVISIEYGLCELAWKSYRIMVSDRRQRVALSLSIACFLLLLIMAMPRDWFCSAVSLNKDYIVIGITSW